MSNLSDTVRAAAPWAGWPFKSPLATTAPVVDLDDEPEDDSPYCRCDNLPMPSELVSGRCAECGKDLK